MAVRKATSFTDTVRSALDQSSALEGGRALAGGMEAWFATVSECQREMVDFASNRLAKDSETTREMLDCKNPAEAMEIHSRWIQETIRDYGAEMTKMFAICTKHAADAVQKKR
jgi:Phasin protein